MARRRSSPMLRVVFVVILLLAGGGGYWWMQRQAAPAAQPVAALDRTPPALPTGPVRLLRLDLTQGRYLAMGETTTAPTGVQATVLVIARTPTGLEGGAAMSVQRKTIDCARGRVFDGNVGSYDADGKLIASKVLASSTMGRPVESDELEANAVCREKPEPNVKLFPGFRAAQRDIQTPPEGYGEVAAAHPQDADAWAWMCAAAARGQWRKQALSDCDRAVKLNPTQAAVRLDRGFLDLLVGRRPEADTDFKAVIAAEPGNAAALYGHSLILGLNGDKAGSKRVRGEALDRDPKVADWVVTTYRLNVSTEYMVR